MNRYLKILGLGILLSLPWIGAQAQQVNLYCVTNPSTPPYIWTPCGPSNPLSVNATVSASITGFPGTTQTTGTPISVTTGGVTGTLPAGAEVVASNVGATNGAYCKLGASASTSDQLIPPNSWFGFTVGTNTQITCITSTSTTTVNLVGGAGLPTGSGGGSGGGGGTVNQGTANTATNGWPVKITDGTNTAAVKAASTAAAQTDTALVERNPDIGTISDATGCGSSNTVSGCLKQLNAQLSSLITGVAAPPTLGSASGGWTLKTLAALTNTAIAVKASAGQVGDYACTNTDATHWAYIQIFNLAAASVTMGSTAPADFLGIPPGQTAGISKNLVGWQYGVAISAGAASTSTGGTAPTTAIDCRLGYN